MLWAGTSQTLTVETVIRPFTGLCELILAG